MGRNENNERITVGGLLDLLADSNARTNSIVCSAVSQARTALLLKDIDGAISAFEWAGDGARVLSELFVTAANALKALKEKDVWGRDLALQSRIAAEFAKLASDVAVLSQEISGCRRCVARLEEAARIVESRRWTEEVS